MVGEYIVTRVEYDILALPDELFNVNPAWQPVFSDVMGTLRVPSRLCLRLIVRKYIKLLRVPIHPIEH